MYKLSLPIPNKFSLKGENLAERIGIFVFYIYIICRGFKTSISIIVDVESSDPVQI